MYAGTIALVFSLLSQNAGGPFPQEAVQADDSAPTRIALTGTTILTDFQRTPDGDIEAIGFEDSVLIIEDGRVKTVLPGQNYRMAPNDIVVTGRGRFVIAAPIAFGGGKDTQLNGWLRGRSLLAAGLSGVGSIVLPKELIESPAGQCAVSRVESKEFPGALPMSAKKAASPDSSVPLLTLTAEDMEENSRLLFTRLIQRIRDLQKAGHSNEMILFGLTNGAAKKIGRSDIGIIETGSKGVVVVTNGNPLDDPSVIFDPYAVVFEDRVLRRAEIEVLRDTSSKGEKQVAATQLLSPPGEGGGKITRWLVSVAAQIFGGVALKEVDGSIAFSSIQGEPRLDQTSGWLRTSGVVGHLDYKGSQVRFRFDAEATQEGLSIELVLNDQEPIKADSPGASVPPLMELAADLAMRAAALTEGDRVFDVQELIYGEGPIGLTPRKLRFTPLTQSECPPCFLDQGDVWLLEVLAPNQLDGAAVSTVIVALREGRPTRIRINSEFGPSWYDQLRDANVSLD